MIARARSRDFVAHGFWFYHPQSHPGSRQARAAALRAWPVEPYDFCRRLPAGRVAKQADARDLKSRIPKGVCGFEPRLGHSLPGMGTRRCQQQGSRRDGGRGFIGSWFQREAGLGLISRPPRQYSPDAVNEPHDRRITHVMPLSQRPGPPPRQPALTAGIWLPWALAPLWVFLPIAGCLVAGVLMRQPLVNAGRSQLPDGLWHRSLLHDSAGTDSSRADASWRAAGDAIEGALVRLVPVAPLATIEPH
jgi:hypothetical protein